MSTPYIGVNDFMTPEQVERMLNFWYGNQRPGLNRRLHVGAMMTYKTLHKTPCKWTNAVPKNKEIEGIFYYHSPETMNCLHYADYRQGYGIQSDLETAIDFGGRGMNALQLDMIWPSSDEIVGAVKMMERNDLEIILQVGKDAFNQVNNKPDELVLRLQEYMGVVGYALLDLSMGTGEEMNPALLEPFLDQIWIHLPWLDMGVAGGLGPGRMDPIKPLLKKYQNLSFDAQSWLRPSGNALDPVDWDMAETYVIEALEMVS